MDIKEKLFQYLLSFCDEVESHFYGIMAFKNQYKIEYYERIKRVDIYDLNTGNLVKRYTFNR
ncbi:hypothetical protein [Lacrimispora sp.]|uniref:hypothetical protein n=1 Tax=Lacrimispora sp. TaxID=2719234 RepID=UPI0028B063FD|nr:hypothetical protein [Lacrimispora sp.]